MRLPTRDELLSKRGMRWMAPFVNHPQFWTLSRVPLARAIGIGLFCSMLPIPLQTIPAAILAIPARANIPVAAACVWISNPLTWIPIYYFNYRVGVYLTGGEAHPGEFSLANTGHILLELWLGSVVVGLVVGFVGYWVVYLPGWLREKHSKRLAEREQRQVDGEQ